MLQSKLFPKTRKESPKEAESANHQLLVRAGFIDQLMAGSWTLLPLGWKVVTKINQIIREEMNAVGGQEMLMPLLHPRKIWDQTGRWDKAKEVMYQFKDTKGKEFALSFTHEEVVMDLLRKNINSHKDLPLSLYHFSTKFRNEPRPRSGILRGREFMMKDLYSAHTTEEDMWAYYEKVKEAYLKAFKRIGLDVKVTDAPGGVFTEGNTHEFQVLAKGGEDTIYYCDKCNWGANKELLGDKVGKKCPKCKKGKIIESKAIEVGNIFPLGTWYAERMKVYYTDEDGKKKPVWFASYGIGCTRVMGALVEVSQDDKGIIWYSQIAPYDVHSIDINEKEKGKKIYEQLRKEKIDVLWDDRDITAGGKFADVDLIGIPYRIVVSTKTGDKIEWKDRASGKIEIITLDQVIKRLK